MRYFWFIFSMFILFLTAYPCCVEDNVTESAKMTISAANDHNHNSSDHDVCSPFCNCTSCGSYGCYLNIFQMMKITAVVQEFTDQHITSYSFQFVSNFEASIWQPPQLN